MVAPLVVPLVMAAATLLGGMMSNAARAKQEKNRLLLEGKQNALNTQAQASQNLAAGSQQSYKDLIDAYRSALIR
jgi:Tfp pilus assembly protein PilN